MAGRIRSIKPEILDTKRTAALSHEAWRLFVSMITLADDYGNLIAEPRRLEGAVFWASPTSTPIEELVVELVAAELVHVYESRGCLFAHLTGWAEHQRVDKPGPAKADKPEEGQLIANIRERLANGSRMAREAPGKIRTGLEGIGREGSGSKPEGRQRPASPERPPNDSRRVVEAWEAGWVERFKPEGGKAPPATDPDYKQAKNLIATYGLDETLKLVTRFLDDTDSFVAERGHMLRDLPSRVARYAKGDGPLFKAKGNIAPSAHVEHGYDATSEFGT
jgi:hypothetical protein